MVHGTSVALSCLSCWAIKHGRHHRRPTLSLRTKLAVVVSVKISLTVSHALLILVFRLMVIVVSIVRSHIFCGETSSGIFVDGEKGDGTEKMWENAVGGCYLCVQIVCYCYSLRLKKATAKVVWL